MIHLVLDNIRSSFNVGSLIRTCNAVGDISLYLCGITAPLAHPKVQKTALGGEKGLNIYENITALDTVKGLKEEGLPIISLELTADAEDFRGFSYPNDFVLIVGNEQMGVDQRLLDISDKKVMIPMNGSKISLNVAIATSVVLYEAVRGRSR